jgi:hypothetical protein
MCAEKDPLECHRTILVARRLIERGIMILHILPDGGIETHEQAIERLLRRRQLPSSDLFRSREEIVREAYALQGEDIAYVQASGTDASVA